MTAVEDAPPELVDDEPAGPDATRADLLTAARRTMVPIRHTFLQKPRPEKPPAAAVNRGAKLAELVKDRHARALDAELMLLAMQPILDGTPLHSEVWARLLSPQDGPLVSPAGMSKTWAVLERLELADRGTRIRRLANIMPLHESGSGEEYTRPGTDAKGTSTGYFWLPTSYWLDGWHQRLSLPGKAMLLIWLSATSQQPTFAMSYEQAPNWYGVSERTAERGIRELGKFGLMGAITQKLAEARAPKGYTIRYHRYLTGDFSQRNRRQAHQRMLAQARGRQAASAQPAEGGESVD